MAIALPFRFAPVPRKTLAILAPVLASFIVPRITPLAPRAAAFLRCELIIPPSDVPSLEPLEFNTATSVYGLPTLLESVNTCTPSGQTGASLRLGFSRAAFVETHATRTGASHSIPRRMRRSRIGGSANLRLPRAVQIGRFCGTEGRECGSPRPAQSAHLWTAVSDATGGTRTPTGCPTGSSVLRVYRCRHRRVIVL